MRNFLRASFGLIAAALAFSAVFPSVSIAGKGTIGLVCTDNSGHKFTSKDRVGFEACVTEVVRASQEKGVGPDFMALPGTPRGNRPSDKDLIEGFETYRHARAIFGNEVPVCR
jgi:hypothetical protein